MFDILFYRTLACLFGALAVMAGVCAIASLCEGSFKCLGFFPGVFGCLFVADMCATDARMIKAGDDPVLKGADR